MVMSSEPWLRCWRRLRSTGWLGRVSTKQARPAGGTKAKEGGGAGSRHSVGYGERCVALTAQFYMCPLSCHRDNVGVRKLPPAKAQHDEKPQNWKLAAGAAITDAAASASADVPLECRRS